MMRIFPVQKIFCHYRSVVWYISFLGSSQSSICAPSSLPWSYLSTIFLLSSLQQYSCISSSFRKTFLPCSFIMFCSMQHYFLIPCSQRSPGLPSPILSPTGRGPGGDIPTLSSYSSQSMIILTFLSQSENLLY